jgi:hypothetical protein
VTKRRISGKLQGLEKSKSGKFSHKQITFSAAQDSSDMWKVFGFLAGAFQKIWQITG